MENKEKIAKEIYFYLQIAKKAMEGNIGLMQKSPVKITLNVHGIEPAIVKMFENRLENDKNNHEKNCCNWTTHDIFITLFTKNKDLKQ